MPSNVRREVITREFYPDGGGAAGNQPMNRLAAQGQHGDTQLAHVNPWEALLLKKLGGAGTINPRTGLRQFYTFYNDNSAEQRGQINNFLNNPLLTNYNPSYVADLGSGYAGGKYSYEDTMNAINTLMTQATTQPTTTNTNTGSTGNTSNSGGDTGGAGEAFFNFPTDIKSESTSASDSYSGLPMNYRDQLLQSLMPTLNNSVVNMESNIDKYTQEALASYEQERQNAIRTGLPAAISNLANRGIINSSQGNEILAKVLSDAATAASDKGYETAMKAALLKANMPTVLSDIANLGKYTSGTSSSYSSDPTEMYSILANLLAAQF